MIDIVGMISMRNEDGTQWLCDFEGVQCWGDIYDAAQFTLEQFKDIADNAEMTRTRDCPDNGFFGTYNATFHEGKIPPTKTPEMLAEEAEDDAFWSMQYEELERFVSALPKVGKPDYVEPMSRLPSPPANVGKTKLKMYQQDGRFHMGYETVSGNKRLLYCMGNVGDCMRV